MNDEHEKWEGETAFYDEIEAKLSKPKKRSPSAAEKSLGFTYWDPEPLALWMTEGVSGKVNKHGGETYRVSAVTNRAFAFIWVTKPEAFGGISIHELAERTGLKKSILYKYAKEYRERFNVPG